jgi:hypothetical protein
MPFDYTPPDKTDRFIRSGGVNRYQRMKVARDLAQHAAEELRLENARLTQQIAELKAKLKDA